MHFFNWKAYAPMEAQRCGYLSSLVNKSVEQWWQMYLFLQSISIVRDEQAILRFTDLQSYSALRL